jgi:hypothetical protein
MQTNAPVETRDIGLTPPSARTDHSAHRGSGHGARGMVLQERGTGAGRLTVEVHRERLYADYERIVPTPCDPGWPVKVQCPASDESDVKFLLTCCETGSGKTQPCHVLADAYRVECNLVRLCRTICRSDRSLGRRSFSAPTDPELPATGWRAIRGGTGTTSPHS